LFHRKSQNIIFGSKSPYIHYLKGFIWLTELTDPFQGMRAHRNCTETQQSVHTIKAWTTDQRLKSEG